MKADKEGFFLLPKEYAMDVTIAPSAFFKKATLSRAEKSRFAKAVKSITLSGQIVGERIPSRVDETYNAQVIQSYTIHLENLLHAVFLCGPIQRFIKPPAIILFTSNTNNAVLSLAIKRLNRQSQDGIVIEDQFTTGPFNILPGDDTFRMLTRYTSFENLKNRQDKAAMYTEWYAKTLLIARRNLIPRAEELLTSPVFYDLNKTIALLAMLKEYLKIFNQQALENTLAGKAAFNTRLKAILQQLSQIT